MTSSSPLPTAINNCDDVRKPLLTVTITDPADLEHGMLSPPASPRVARAQVQGQTQALNDLYGMRWPPRPLFIVQASISAAVVVFCCVMLATHAPGCEMQPYLTMLSTIIALWVPNPKNI